MNIIIVFGISHSNGTQQQHTCYLALHAAHVSSVECVPRKMPIYERQTNERTRALHWRPPTLSPPPLINRMVLLCAVSARLNGVLSVCGYGNHNLLWPWQGQDDDHFRRCIWLHGGLVSFFFLYCSDRCCMPHGQRSGLDGWCTQNEVQCVTAGWATFVTARPFEILWATA